MDAALAEWPPEQRVGVNTPCMIEAAGAWSLHETSGQSELYAFDALCDHNSDGDVDRYVMSRWWYAMLSVWAGSACFVPSIALSPPLYDQMLEEDGVKPSGGVTVRYCVAVPVSPLVFSEKSPQEGAFVTAQASVGGTAFVTLVRRCGCTVWWRAERRGGSANCAWTDYVINLQLVLIRLSIGVVDAVRLLTKTDFFRASLSLSRTQHGELCHIG